MLDTASAAAALLSTTDWTLLSASSESMGFCWCGCFCLRLGLCFVSGVVASRPTMTEAGVS